MVYDAIVLGTGGVGSAALFALAERGLQVLGIDRFPPGHSRGSSHGESRIIRRAYFEHSDYVPLLQRAYELWDRVEGLARKPLLHRVGLLEVGPADGVVVPGVLKSAQEHRLAIEHFPQAHDIAHQHLAGFQIPPGMSAVYEPDAGYLLVEDCVVAQASAAVERGAMLHIGETVTGWRTNNDALEVLTDRGRYSTARLLITAGAWAGDLLNQLQIPLRVVRKHVHWFRQAAGGGGAPRSTFLFEMPQGVFYGFPEVRRGEFKIAEHSGGATVTDPLTDPPGIDAADLERVQRFVAECLPRIASSPTRHSRCFYTLSPDEHFVVDRHPEHPQVVFAAGLSGHGFKFAPVLGEVLADLALDGRSRHSIEFLSLRRFAH